MDRAFVFACAAAVSVLAGCAWDRPDTTAMGAGPSCDLRLDVGADHRCAVTHVTPPDPQAQLTWEMRQFELQSTSRVR